MLRHRLHCSAEASETNMFFLIRCVFWLWVVFSTIFAQPSADDGVTRRPDPGRQPAATAQPVAHLVEAWLGAATARVADRCMASPAACMAVAQQLSKLAASREAPPARSTVAKGGQLPSLAAHQVDVPLPPRRPVSFAKMAVRPTLEKTARHEYLMGQDRAEADF